MAIVIGLLGTFVTVLVVKLVSGEERVWDEETPEEEERKDAEWANTMAAMVREPETDTGALDLSWFQTHIKLDDIEERLSDAVGKVTAQAIALLREDQRWVTSSGARIPVAHGTLPTIALPSLAGDTVRLRRESRTSMRDGRRSDRAGTAAKTTSNIIFPVIPGRY